MPTGYGRAWGKVAAAVMARDAWTCQSCGARAEEVDHIVPREQGGPDSPENCWALCSHCHRIKTQLDRPGGVARVLLELARRGVGVAVPAELALELEAGFLAPPGGGDASHRNLSPHRAVLGGGGPEPAGEPALEAGGLPMFGEGDR